VPNRLSILTEKIERGDSITREDVDRVAALQSLDAAMQPSRFLDEMLNDEQTADAVIRDLVS